MSCVFLTLTLILDKYSTSSSMIVWFSSTRLILDSLKVHAYSRGNLRIVGLHMKKKIKKGLKVFTCFQRKKSIALHYLYVIFRIIWHWTIKVGGSLTLNILWLRRGFLINNSKKASKEGKYIYYSWHFKILVNPLFKLLCVVE